jgi:omega-amidase
MTITLLQTNLFWEDQTANLAHFNQLIANIDTATDLIILPEMFTTGFSMRPESLAEPTEGLAWQYMRQWAQTKDAAICGSIIAHENGRYYNRLIWMQPDGQYFTYDKRHLFGLANENQHYSAGEHKLIVTWRGWRICPLICYDIRFPVWSRNVEDYDMLIYVANFPTRRIKAWNSLLVARAIENQCFAVGVNRIGVDGNDIPHSGDSSIIDYEGNLLFYQSEGKEICYTMSLDKSDLLNFRQNLPFLKDKDSFIIL